MMRKIYSTNRSSSIPSEAFWTVAGSGGGMLVKFQFIRTDCITHSQERPDRTPPLPRSTNEIETEIIRDGFKMKNIVCDGE